MHEEPDIPLYHIQVLIRIVFARNNLSTCLCVFSLALQEAKKL